MCIRDSKKAHYSEVKKLVMRFEEGGSQEQLVVELCEHFLKPLANAMSSNFSLSEHVLDADERADEGDDEDMNALFDGYRPLNNSLKMMSFVAVWSRPKFMSKVSKK